jgi:hypothetical protein
MGNPWTPGRWKYDAGETKDGKAGFFVHVNGAGIWSDQDNDGGVCSLPDARLIAAAPEMAEALDLLEDAASCLAATFERIPANYPERSAIHTHEGHTEAYLLDQIKAARVLLSRIRGNAP